MSKFYRSYIWKDGIPLGVQAIDEPFGCYYKIPMDPYRKRIAVEAYQGTTFLKVAYDSALLDFRHLKPAEQLAWQKVILSETAQEVVAAIYNQDDRLVFFENYTFKNQLCCQCITTSAHGVRLSKQKMFYQKLDDPINGFILFDANDCPVMGKIYQCDQISGQFTELVSEVWDGRQVSTLISPLTAH